MTLQSIKRRFVSGATGPMLALAVVVGAVYANSLGNGFVWDDRVIVVGPADAESPSLMDLLGRGDGVKDEDIQYYRPLNRMTYVIDRSLYGDDPIGYHVENVAVHLITVLLLFFLARRLFGEFAPALAASLLFAVHPIHTEAVDFISARNGMLAAMFALAAFLAHLAGVSPQPQGATEAPLEPDPSTAPGNRLGLRFASALLLLLGLLCKETALMVLPFIALWGSPKGSLRSRIGMRVSRLWPYALVLCIYAVLRTRALDGVVGTELDLPDLGSRLLGNLYTVPEYFAALLLPVQQRLFHEVPSGALANPLVLALVWAAILTAVVWLWRGRRPVTRLGILWFAVNLAPIANIVPIPSAVMAERYLYLPSVGFFLVAADQLYALAARVGTPRWVWVACALLCVAMGARTAVRNRDWRDDLSLFEAEVEVNSRSAKAYFNLCTSRIEARDLQKAVADCQRAIDRDPNHGKTLAQLANLLRTQGRYHDAESLYRRSVSVVPGDAQVRYNFATLLDWNGKPAQALSEFEIFLRLAPPDHPALEKARAHQQQLRARGITPAATMKSETGVRAP
jgi:hypothetical protein